jgi:hypothetical protein
MAARGSQKFHGKIEEAIDKAVCAGYNHHQSFAMEDVMKLHVIFGQRAQHYDGEYFHLPEALAVMDARDFDENEEWLLKKLSDRRRDPTFTRVEIIEIDLGEASEKAIVARFQRNLSVEGVVEAPRCATCGHSKDLHEGPFKDGSFGMCHHNDFPSGSPRCLCQKFSREQLDKSPSDPAAGRTLND